MTLTYSNKHAPGMGMCWSMSTKTSIRPAPSSWTSWRRRDATSGQSRIRVSRSTGSGGRHRRTPPVSPVATSTRTALRSVRTIVLAKPWCASSRSSARPSRPRPTGMRRGRRNRGRTGFVEVVHAPDLFSEAAAVRDQVERLRRERNIPTSGKPSWRGPTSVSRASAGCCRNSTSPCSTSVIYSSARRSVTSSR